MDPERLYFYGLILILVSAAVAFPILFFVTAPYGRYRREGWGPLLPSRLAWVAMELPAVVVFAVVFFRGEHSARLVPLLFFGLWQLHYVHRTLIYPFVARMSDKRSALTAALLAFVFNCVNASLNAYAITHGWLRHENSWLGDPRFLIGVSLFLAGFALNLNSDARLRALRTPGETGYKIPYGGAFRWVSCPNYFGEIVEWCGWALATWTYAGAAFAIFSIANLLPRAVSHHRWYREQFPDYPKDRKALVPGVL
jgi:steroid 5-alpha reductase family enzyme